MLPRRQPSPVPGDQPLLARGGRAAGPLDHTADRGQLQGLKGQQDSGLPAGSGVRELLLPELELRGLPDLSTPWGQAESHCMATRKPAGMHEAANLRAWPQGRMEESLGQCSLFPPVYFILLEQCNPHHSRNHHSPTEQTPPPSGNPSGSVPLRSLIPRLGRPCSGPDSAGGNQEGARGKLLDLRRLYFLIRVVVHGIHVNLQGTEGCRSAHVTGSYTASK